MILFLFRDAPLWKSRGGVDPLPLQRDGPCNPAGDKPAHTKEKKGHSHPNMLCDNCHNDVGSGAGLETRGFGFGPGTARHTDSRIRSGYPVRVRNSSSAMSTMRGPVRQVKPQSN